MPVPSCATVTVQKIGIPNWPKILTIDFGGTNCMCDDGKNRRGAISARFSNGWLTPPPVGEKDSITITFTNYAVNDTLFTGTRTFIKDSLSASNLAVTLIVTDGGVIYPSNDTIKWNYIASLDLAIGVPGDYTDNIITLGVNGQVTDASNTTYAIETPQSLVAKFNCLSSCLFVQGALKLTNSTTTTVTIGKTTYNANEVTVTSGDFGSGTCDGLVDLAITITGTNIANGNQLFQQSTTNQINCDEFVDFE